MYLYILSLIYMNNFVCVCVCFNITKELRMTGAVDKFIYIFFKVKKKEKEKRERVKKIENIR